MPRHFAIRFLALSLLTLLSLGSSAWGAAPRVYKWVDADGVTHYSQTPPPPGTPGGEALQLKLPPAPPEAPPPTKEQELQALQERMRVLEKKLEAERQVRAQAEAQQDIDAIVPPELEPPEDSYGIVYPWRPPLRFRRRHRPIGPSPLKPPTTPNATPDLYRVPSDYYSTRPRPPAKPRPPGGDEPAQPAPRKR